MCVSLKRKVLHDDLALFSKTIQKERVRERESECVCMCVCVCVGEHVFSDFPALATREIRLLQEWRGVGMGG